MEEGLTRLHAWGRGDGFSMLAWKCARMSLNCFNMHGTLLWVIITHKELFSDVYLAVKVSEGKGSHFYSLWSILYCLCMLVPSCRWRV